MDEEIWYSFECIQVNQIFFRKQLIWEDENFQVFFFEFYGESIEFVGCVEDVIIVFFNYRFYIKFKEFFVNVLLQFIESVEC